MRRPWGVAAAERRDPVYAFGRYLGRYPLQVDGVPEAVDVAVRSELGAAVAFDVTLQPRSKPLVLTVESRSQNGRGSKEMTTSMSAR